MRSLIALLGAPLIVTAACWAVMAACLDVPDEPGPAAARLIVVWDPLACGDPHRVAIELEDDTGVSRAASVPCSLGGLTVDVAQLGSYRGRIYAWAIGAPIRSVTALDMTIDQAIVHWRVATPR